MTKMTSDEYQQRVEQQGQALLDAVRSVALGDLNVQIPTLEGVPVLADLAVGIERMIEGLREMLTERDRARAELEQVRQEPERRVAERTRELEVALAEVQSAQRRYLRQEWEEYTTTAESRRGYFRFGDQEGPTDEAWLPAMSTAAQQADVVIEKDGPHGSTLALPITLMGETIGVLGFSREGSQAWSGDEIAMAQAVSEQVALALENQRLFDQTRAALAEVETTHRHYLREQWEKFLADAADKPTSYQDGPAGLSPAGDQAPPVTLTVPIKLRGEPIGTLEFYDEGDSRAWSADERALVEVLADQAALALENARLFEQTERLATRERLINQITARIRASVGVPAILGTAARELATMVNVPHAVARLRPPEESDTRTKKAA